MRPTAEVVRYGAVKTAERAARPSDARIRPSDAQLRVSHVTTIEHTLMRARGQNGTVSWAVEHLAAAVHTAIKHRVKLLQNLVRAHLHCDVWGGT